MNKLNSVKRYDWRAKVGVRPTSQNAEAFRTYVEIVYTLLEEFSSADLPYSEVRQMCQPQYFFTVVNDMRTEKLSMRIYTSEEGTRIISIHKVAN
jgi:hypothetical protein